MGLHRGCCGNYQSKGGVCRSSPSPINCQRLHDQLTALPQESLDGLAGGVDGGRKQWVDLNGEGIAGVLIDADGAWYYKSNLGEGILTRTEAFTHDALAREFDGVECKSWRTWGATDSST